MTCSGAPLDDVRAVPHGPHLLRSLVAVTGAARTAEEFHGTLALHLAQVLDMHAVLVVELDGDGSTMRTHAAVIGGRRVPNFSYTLEDTPCESVHGKGVCVYRDEVAALFPKDKDLHEWGIRSYAGAPLYDSSGRPNGVIAVLGRRPIDDPDHVCELLTLFSHRAAAEMERQQALARLALTEERLRVAFDNGTMGIGVSDRQHIVDANGRLCGMLGYTADELRGRPWATITHPDDREASAAAMARFDDGTTAHVELRKRFLRKDGGVVHTHTRVSCHRDGGGEPRLFTCFVEDLTPALEAAAELNRLSTVDPVTGLLNRAQLFETLQRRLSQCPPTCSGVALYVLDIDHFEDVNAAWGYAVGDQLLAQVGARLAALAGPEDAVARVGNDEFAIVQCPPGGAHGAMRHAARLVDQMNVPFRLPVGEVSITVSVGVAFDPDRDESSATILDRASRALHAAMQTHNTWTMHTEALDAGVRERIELGNDLGVALAQAEGMHVAFQPIVDAATGRPACVEALARWTHPQLGPVSPGRFVPIAEERGLIEPLTRFVLGEALDRVAEWRTAQPDLHVTVNISALDFRAPGFVERITAALDARGLPGDCLVLELTETVLDSRLDETAAQMRALSARGVTWALDDFGTGFSSLRYLKRLPFTHLKVAQEFVRDMQTDADSQEIVRAVVSMGQALGLEIIAEGVETAEDAARLEGMGCRIHQGYRYHRPGPPEAVSALIGGAEG